MASIAAVHLSAQRSADRSVRRLMKRRRRTAPASRWAARPHSGPPGRGKSTPVDAVPLPLPPPPLGAQWKAPAPLRSARATHSCHPPIPLQVALPLALKSLVVNNKGLRHHDATLVTHR